MTCISQQFTKESKWSFLCTDNQAQISSFLKVYRLSLICSGNFTNLWLSHSTDHTYRPRRNLSEHNLSLGSGSSPGVPAGKDLGPVKLLWDGNEVPPSPMKGHGTSGSIMGWRFIGWICTAYSRMDRHASVKTVPSPSFGCGR